MSKKIATREAYGKALSKLATTNKNVVVLDADLSKSTKTADFKAVAPERFFNMGIAEANMLCLQLEELLSKLEIQFVIQILM